MISARHGEEGGGGEAVGSTQSAIFFAPARAVGKATAAVGQAPRERQGAWGSGKGAAGGARAARPRPSFSPAAFARELLDADFCCSSWSHLGFLYVWGA